MKNQSFKMEIGGRELKFEIRNLAERANGEVLVKYGDTQVLATCVMSEVERPELEFFPLTVNFEERYYAAGKILGSRYIKREGKPSDNATVTARLIDRAIRPRFEENLKREIQIILTCLSWDGENDPDILGLIAASLALTISDIPWQGPIGAARLGIKDGKLMLNPIYGVREESLLDIIFTGPKEGNEVLVNMIEGEGEEVGEELVLKAFDFAKNEIKRLIEFQEKIQKEIGKEKVLIEKAAEPKLEKEIKKFLGNKIEKILFENKRKISKEQGLEKAKKLNTLKRELLDFIEEKYPEKRGITKDFFEKEVKKLIHEKVLKEERRVDGRKLDEIREISAEAGLIPRAHGSGLFCRGLTKSLSILTLGGPSDRQLIEGMEIRGKKRFLHHYNFPPYSVGEVKPLRAPSRREIGHGMLVEKALLPLIPDFDNFPYTIRIVSEMLSSSGSTSMAAVCSSSLSLMDAGVPIKRAAAGIAIGLVMGANDYKLLTDIQGPEDFHGHMDLKVAGTRKGITALQVDMKTKGINKEILKEALSRGKKARLEILDLIEKVLLKPRTQLSPFAPKILSIQIDPEKIGLVIGAKGRTINQIAEGTGATIDIQDSGLIFVTAETKDAAKKAIAKIKNITREVKVGDSFRGEVQKVFFSGAIVKAEAGFAGFLPKKSFGRKEIKRGDTILVQVKEIDKQGRVNLSLKR